MTLTQELTENDVKEGLLRVSKQNLSFFCGEKGPSKDFKLEVMLPNGKKLYSSIKYYPETGVPRFLKDIRVQLRTFYQEVSAKAGDVLSIGKTDDNVFVVQYHPQHIWQISPESLGPKIEPLISENAHSNVPGSISSVELDGIEGGSASRVAPLPSSTRKGSNFFPQDELEDLESEAKKIGVLLDGFEGEDQDILSKRRVNQGRFRKSLLRYWGSRCSVSEVADERLLVASHIVPWSKAASKSERGDPANGLLLSVVWDALFDRGLISFRDDGSAILDRLDSGLLAALGILETKTAISSDKLTSRHREYLKRHRWLFGFELPQLNVIESLVGEMDLDSEVA